MATYLITGVAGFIGSHLADALLARGHRVRGFDNLSTGRRDNVPHGVDFIVSDLANPDTVAKACLGVDAILHQAALPSVPRSIKNPRASHVANVEGTFNLLEGARAAGIRRVIYAASSSAYGNQPGFPRVESMQPQPLSPYAAQKLTGELYMQTYAQVYGMETVCLRYFNVFGPRQAGDSPYSGAIAKFCRTMIAHDPSPPTIFGDGEQSRDFTFVTNAVNANLLALDAAAERVAGKVFNIACGEQHSVNETYRLLAAMTGYAHAPTYGPARPGDVRDSLASITAAQNALGYKPSICFSDGLKQTVAWYREQAISTGGHS